jgi:hypothetical protein
LDIVLSHHRTEMFESSYRARDGAIVQPAFRKNIVAQANGPAFCGNFGDFRKGRDSGDGGPDGIGSRIYGDDADGFWQSGSSCLRQSRKKIARLRKNTITCFMVGEISMKTFTAVAALASGCDPRFPEFSAARQDLEGFVLSSFSEAELTQ